MHSLQHSQNKYFGMFNENYLKCFYIYTNHSICLCCNLSKYVLSVVYSSIKVGFMKITISFKWLHWQLARLSRGGMLD